MNIHFPFSMSSDDPVPDRAQRERMVFGALRVFFTLILLSMLLYQLSDGLDGRTLGRFGSSLLFFFSALLCGVLPGFLFALPRTTTPPDTQTQAKPDAARFRPGNLEEIADWLTKILLGVGLTQLNGLSSRLWQWSTTLSDTSYATKAHAPFVLCLLLSGAVLGFLYGYLTTRLKINLLMISEDTRVKDIGGAVTTLNKKVSVAADDVEQQATTGQDARAAATELAKKKFDEMRSKEEKIAWARAQVVLRNWNDAARAYKSLSNEFSDDLDIRLEYTRALQQAGDFSGAKIIARQLTHDASDDESLLGELKLDEMMRLLYEPEQWSKVIELGTELRTNKACTSQPRYWVYMAAAYGQQHRHLKSSNAAPGELDAARANALDAVKHMKEIDKEDNWQMFMRGLLSPKEVPGHPDDENDLESFKDDMEFRQVLGLT